MTITERIAAWKAVSAVCESWYDANHHADHDALLDEVLGATELTALAQAGSDAAVANGLQPRTSQVETWVTKKGLSRIIGEDKTAAFMVWLKSQAVPAENTLEALIAAEKFIGRIDALDSKGGGEKQGIDLADAMTQGLIAMLVGEGKLAVEDQAALLAACTKTAPITAEQVSTALLCLRPNGTITTELP